jgi:hypothetical protein
MMSRSTRTAAGAVLVPYIISRVLVLGALAVTRHVFSTLNTPHTQRIQASLVGWDAGWYRDITHGGYNSVPREGLRFFPLFPMTARVLDWLPGVSAGAAVVVLANVFAFVLGLALYALVRQERPDDAALARRAVWIVFLAPPAYVLVMGYAEALFMTAATVALMTVRSRRWWWAALAGLVAALTRPVGVFLAVPAFCEGLKSRDKSALAAVAAPVAGLFSYLLWAAHRTHDFWYPFRVQQDPAKRGRWVDPVRAVGHAVHELFAGDHVSAGIHAVTAVLAVLLVVVLFRRWPFSFAIYATVALVVALSSHNLDSLERYALAIVPLVLAAADLIGTKRDVEEIVFVAAAAGLVAASVLAFTGVMVP